MQSIVDKTFKSVFAISLLICIYLYFYKDKLPEVSFWTTIISLVGVVLMFFVIPFKGRYA